MKFFRIGDKFAREWTRIRRKVDGIAGPNVQNDREKIYIGLQPTMPPVVRQPTNAGPFLFPVRLVVDGGSAGANKSAACSFTYKVLRYNANIITYSDTDVLAEHVTLTGWGNGLRALALELAAASWGWAFYYGNTLKLLFADEIPAGEQDCS